MDRNTLAKLFDSLTPTTLAAVIVDLTQQPACYTEDLHEAMHMATDALEANVGHDEAQGLIMHEERKWPTAA